MSNLENIKQRAAHLIAVDASLSLMRETWATTTEPFLVKTLLEIQRNIPLLWSVSRNEVRKNMEGVELVMNTVSSGISEGGVVAPKIIAKIGAKIIFAQNYHGHVCVMTQMPILEGLMQPSPPNLQAIVPPEKVDETFVMTFVENFLIELADWEDGETSDNSEHRTIGFSRKKA